MAWRSRPSSAAASRDRALDLVRAVAVLLVMGTHLRAAPPDLLPSWVDGGLEVLRRGGWIGVDLFFSLSGFLVAGLLFREQAATGRIDAVRFLIRRGFKIYPAYYAVLAGTAVLMATGAYPIELKRLLHSAIFIGNYTQSAWTHLWSLAVEEHFYILLAVLLGLSARRTQARLVPFGVLPGFIVVLYALTASGRIWWMQDHPGEWIGAREFTHFRLDALAGGVGLAWMRQYHGAAWERLLERAPILLTVGVACLVPPFVLSLEGHWFYAVGFTLYSIGSSLILVGALGLVRRASWWLPPLASLGRRSYSVYLVHYPVEALSARVLDASTQWPAYAICYVVLTMAAGTLMAVTIEDPLLRLRDRRFPSNYRVAVG